MFFSICQVQSGNARDKRVICRDENIHTFSTRERDTSSSSVIFADILVPTQAIKVHMHCHNLRSENPNFNSFNIVSTDWHWLLLLVTCVRDASQHDPTPSNPLPNVQTQILI